MSFLIFIFNPGISCDKYLDNAIKLWQTNDNDTWYNVVTSDLVHSNKIRNVLFVLWNKFLNVVTHLSSRHYLGYRLFDESNSVDCYSLLKFVFAHIVQLIRSLPIRSAMCCWLDDVEASVKHETHNITWTLHNSFHIAILHLLCRCVKHCQ